MAKTALAPGDPSTDSKGNAAMSWVTERYESTRTFLSDVRAEMRKVVTPSRKDVQATTTVVLVTVFVFAAFFFVTDYVFSNGLAWVMGKLVGPQ